MRNFALVGLVLLSSPALADVEQSSTTPLAAGADPCKELGGDAETCKKVTTVKVKDVGPATLYRVDQEGTVTFGVTMDDHGTVALAAPITVNTNDCGAGKCDLLMKAKPALKALKIEGGPTVALDLTLARRREMNEGPKHPRSYTVREFQVCRLAKGSWNCKRVGLGSLDERCTATLSAAGAIKSRCEKTISLF